MRVLVIGGTGQVGREVCAALGARGVTAIPAARRASEGGVSVTLEQPDTIATAARGCDAAFLNTPVGPDEATIGVNAVEALRAAGVGKIVALGIHNLEAMAEIPHFACKIPIKAAVLADPRGVVLEANFFFQNDALFLPAILAGVYALPIGSAGVASVDVADIGRAAANAIVSDAWDGRAVPVCGPEVLTGEALAANWAGALGRPVVYGGDAIEPFLAGLARVIPGMSPWLVRDFDLMMRVTQAMGCRATAADQDAARAVIGAPQRSHADFAKHLAATLPQRSPA